MDGEGPHGQALCMLGLDFHVAGPPELVEYLALLSRRYAQAIPAR